MIVRQYAPCSLGRSIICLGKQGEINALRVEFDVSAWMAMYPDATVKLMHFAPDRPQDNPVIPTLGVEGTLRVWIVGEEDTAGAGNGVIELLLIDERTGSTIKSATGYTTVLRSPSAGIEAQEAEAGYVRYDIDQSALLTDEQKAVARKNIGAGTGDGTGSGGILKETDPTVPDWAKQPRKPTYTASEVGARPDTWTPSASDVGADAAGTASGAVAAHNVSGAAHADLRALIEGLNSRLNALADSDDTTLDQLSEIVAYIKSNKALIDAVTTGKVSVSDIVDNLTTNASGKVLSAAQGVALKAMIDGIVIPTALPNPQPITINGQRYDGSEEVTLTVNSEGGGTPVEIDDTLTQSGKAADAKAVGDRLNELNEAIVNQATLDGKVLTFARDGVSKFTVDLSSLNTGGGSGDSGGETEPTTHGIVWNLINATSSNPITSVSDGASLIAVLTAADGYVLGDVTITMGGEVLTGAWNKDTATITIASVTGDVMISCAGVEQTGSVDTGPVIAQSDVGYNANGEVTSFQGVAITKSYEFTPDINGIKGSGYYDETNDYTTQAGLAGVVEVYTPNTKMVEAGYSTSGITTKASKTVLFRDGAVASAMSNACLTSSNTQVRLQFARQNTNSMYANSIAFTISELDADDSYAYWNVVNNTVLPVGVRAGDIIFAGKNTPYYGMANIDGTKAGQTAAAELSYDDDYAQDYGIATTSILGEETNSNPSSAYGVSAEMAAVIDEARTAWMIEYGGDYRKIPIIVSTDQHGRRNKGIWNMLGATLSMYDVSKIMNLGDTVSVEWNDKDTTKPLLSCAQLENWAESVEKIPFSKQLNVYGNHDTWYGNYADEGNVIGTRYPTNLSHLDQYFRNIYARRTNNTGWFVLKDDYFNVKYLIVSGFEYQGTVTFRIGTAQMKFIIDEMSKDDGYDIVIAAHVPLYYQQSTNAWPVVTPDDVSDTSVLRVSALDTDALFNARKNKSSGTITDSDGVAHTYDFSGCTTNILCSLHGHTHNDAYNYVGGADNGLLSTTFDWFDGNTIFFGLIDRVNSQLNIWKVEGDALTVTNYQIPFNKPLA